MACRSDMQVSETNHKQNIKKGEKLCRDLIKKAQMGLEQ
jgi:hypothetical protein